MQIPITDGTRLEWLIVGKGKERAVHISGNDARGWCVFACNNGMELISPKGCKTYRIAIDAAILRTL